MNVSFLFIYSFVLPFSRLSSPSLGFKERVNQLGVAEQAARLGGVTMVVTHVSLEEVGEVSMAGKQVESEVRCPSLQVMFDEQ